MGLDRMRVNDLVGPYPDLTQPDEIGAWSGLSWMVVGVITLVVRTICSDAREIQNMRSLRRVGTLRLIKREQREKL